MGDKVDMDLKEKLYIDLIAEYTPLINKSAESFSGKYGLITEELKVIASNALCRAFDTYQNDKGVPFPAYAKKCVTNACISEYRRAKKKYIRVSSLNVSKAAEAQGPSRREALEALIGNCNLSLLSELEKKVLKMRIDGMPYSEIAAELNKDFKSVDNALKRAKNKLKKANQN